MTSLPGRGHCCREPRLGQQAPPWCGGHGVPKTEWDCELCWTAGDTSHSGLRSRVWMGTLPKETGIWPHALSPVRVQLSGTLFLWLRLLFGQYHMLEEGQDPSCKQSSQG